MSSLWFFEFGQTDYTTFLLIWILFFYLSWDIWGEALRPTIQIAGRYVFEAKVTGVHQVTGNAENSSFPGIAGNDLNRCEVRALQHKKFTQTAKERLYSLQTVG